MGGYYTIAIIAFLAAVSPGPDFFVVTKNAIAHDRYKAMWTSFGIGCGILVHSTYCILGLGLIISQSLLLFSLLKYLGASYLIYLGIKSLLSKNKKLESDASIKKKVTISSWKAFCDGFLTNLLNPKCTLFMLSVFTLVVKPHTPYIVQSIYAIEIFTIDTIWFIFLSLSLTHKAVKAKMERLQHVVTKVIGVVLIALGLAVAFETRA